MTQFAAGTHPGLKRDHNEDCYEADAALGLWLVADGVGGHSNGEVASAIVGNTIKADLAVGKSLVEAIQHAHSAVLEEIRARDGKSNMGSTVVALTLSEGHYDIAWVGDSRAYLFDGELTQLTRDHSPVGDMLASGAITAEQAANHPKRHVLSQSLGISESVSVAPDSVSGRLKAGQQILLCTDGLTDELSDRAIADQLLGHTNPKSQVDALVNAALSRGGNDNITALIIGSPDNTAQDPLAQGAGLEETQNIGEAIRSSNSGDRKSYDAKVWLILAAIVVVAAMVAMS